MEFKVKNKIIEIKFDYRTRYKANKKLATQNQETGESNNDGVATLFNNILNRNDKGIVDLIMLAANTAGSKAITEDDALSAIEKWLTENEASDTDDLFKEIQEEMVESGFFKEEISKYITNMETSLEYMEGQEDVSDIQLKAIEKMIGKMKNAIS
ncbi:tail assembly chaperone [Streptococcus sp. ZY19097]|uniref:tail assembly chaperone n=1 Tax=Streptococcus sp. ZY19097 TaxID=3231906 RepID=UPI00345923C2